jgi:hypothetical protein
MVVFGLFILITMLIVAGMGVDLMRYESQRTGLQSGLDRGVLAAANPIETRDATMVVESYMRAQTQPFDSVQVSAVTSPTERSVSGLVHANLNTIFLKLLGIEELDMEIRSTAAVGAGKLEVMLVLDTSLSMASENRLANMQAAAGQLINTAFAGGNTVMGIVPYSTNVNLGSDVMDLFPNLANRSFDPPINCTFMPSSVYTTNYVSPSTPLDAMNIADTESTTDLTGAYLAPALGTPESLGGRCPAGANEMVLGARTPEAALSVVQGLVPFGETAINTGMRWATNFLSPDSAPEYRALMAAGALPTDPTIIPDSYYTEGSQKIIVLMTDGNHTPENRVAQAYKRGQSPIVRSTADGLYSIELPKIEYVTNPDGTSGLRVVNRYWVPHLGLWQDTAYDAGGGTSRLNWAEVWETFRMSYVAQQFYARAYSGGSPLVAGIIYEHQMSVFREVASTIAMDNMLDNVCRKARDNGIIVFAISYEAPPEGQALMANCATTPNHYYSAESTTIDEVFTSVGNSITNLRLTQ